MSARPSADSSSPATAGKIGNMASTTILEPKTVVGCRPQVDWGRIPPILGRESAIGQFPMFSLDDLAETIARRADVPAGQSYTRSLLDKGATHCARKFGEEAIELTIAGAAEDEAAVRAEAADVLYHLLVLLKARDVPSPPLWPNSPAARVRAATRKKRRARADRSAGFQRGSPHGCSRQTSRSRIAVPTLHARRMGATTR